MITDCFFYKNYGSIRSKHLPNSTEYVLNIKLQKQFPTATFTIIDPQGRKLMENRHRIYKYTDRNQHPKFKNLYFAQERL